MTPVLELTKQSLSPQGRQPVDNDLVMASHNGHASRSMKHTPGLEKCSIVAEIWWKFIRCVLPLCFRVCESAKTINDINGLVQVQIKLEQYRNVHELCAGFVAVPG